MINFEVFRIVLVLGVLADDIEWLFTSLLSRLLVVNTKRLNLHLYIHFIIIDLTAQFLLLRIYFLVIL